MQAGSELTGGDDIRQILKPIAEDVAEKFIGFLAEAKKNYFGFFSPYGRFTGFTGLGPHLAAPFVVPVALTLLMGISVTSAAVTALAIPGGLFVAACASLAGMFSKNAKEAAKDVFKFSFYSGIISAACLALACALVVVNVVVTSLLIASLFTRSGATAYSALSKSFFRSEAPQNNEIGDRSLPTPSS